jgi:hypothetical protein
MGRSLASTPATAHSPPNRPLNGAACKGAAAVPLDTDGGAKRHALPQRTLGPPKGSGGGGRRVPRGSCA